MLFVLAAVGGVLLLAHSSTSSIGKPPERLCTRHELATKTLRGDCVYRVGNHWQYAVFSPPIPSLLAALTVRVYLNGCSLGMAGTCRNLHRRYSLRCDPAGGTMPDAVAACSALTDLTAHRYHGIGGCTGPAPNGGPSTAQISGSVNHHSYTLDLESDNSWCGDPPRALLRDYWILSTFPCTIRVDHERPPGAPAAYPGWAHWAGCPSEADTIVFAPPSVVTLVPAGVWGRIWEVTGERRA